MVQITADHLAGAGGGEPQRSNNFYVEFGLIPSARLFVSGVAFPQYQVDTEEIRQVNLFRKYVTGVRYGDIQLTIYDIIDEHVAKELDTWWSRITPDGEAVHSPEVYKDEATLGWVDGSGGNKRSWTLEGVFPKGINFGQGNMGSAEPVEIEITLSVDKITRGG